MAKSYIRINPAFDLDFIERLDRVVKADDRSRAYIVKRGVIQYVEDRLKELDKDDGVRNGRLQRANKGRKKAGDK